jgi:phosphate transport system substrate-binding protein
VRDEKNRRQKQIGEVMNSKIKQAYLVAALFAVVLSACAPTATQAPVATEVVVVDPTAVPATEIAPTTVSATEAPAAAPTSAPAVVAALPEVDLASLTGDVYSAGSSTVYPVSETIAEMFQNEGFAGTVKIDSIGTGAGFERFCKTGETDISNASRKIKDAELENCKTINRTPVEFRIGTDALAIVVSSENDFLTDISAADLAKVFSSDAKKWSDVNPSWPAEDIQRFVPGTDSGTYDYFIESVMIPVYGQTDKEEAKKAFLEAASLSQSEDDNVLVQGVEGSKYAIGFFGYAYFNENASKLKAVSVEGVAPSFTSAEDGSYKLSRPLFLYSDATIMKDKPQVAAFINYYLRNVSETIGTVGYFPASEEAMQASRQAWLDAVK